MLANLAQKRNEIWKAEKWKLKEDNERGGASINRYVFCSKAGDELGCLSRWFCSPFKHSG
jgi:hypothetical protein